MALFILFISVMTGLLVVIVARLERSLLLFRITKRYTAALTAPSVSVCIPARNETHAMTQCLERVLASDYKKLEIIVYDDGSADDTSILIRSFAHAGVRFVPGADLPDGWLGKNHALEVLAREASGTYVVFMDVDTFVKPTTISELVGYAMTEDADMVSVIPGRNDARRASAIFGHLRYFWELVLSNAKAPASSSSLWLTKRQLLLERFDGFAMFKSDVSIEASLAQRLGARYRCLISTEELGVTYEKKWHSQVETSQRLLYPKAGGTWWQGLIVTVLLAMLNTPLFILLATPITGWTLFQIMALWLTLVFMAVYATYTYHIWNRGWWLGGLSWPFVIFQELILFMRSTYGYVRGTITWKGRLVTKNKKQP